MTLIDRLCNEAASVLKQWSDGRETNIMQVRAYVKRHEWLRPDIAKLSAHVNLHHLVKVAVTDEYVYGTDCHGRLYIAPRLSIHIPPNFS